MDKSAAQKLRWKNYRERPKTKPKTWDEEPWDIDVFDADALKSDYILSLLRPKFSQSKTKIVTPYILNSTLLGDEQLMQFVPYLSYSFDVVRGTDGLTFYCKYRTQYEILRDKLKEMKCLKN